MNISPKTKGKFTKSEIMELRPAISRASDENSLKKLVDVGELTRHGTGRTTFYVQNVQSKRVAYTRRQPIYLNNVPTTTCA